MRNTTFDKYDYGMIKRVDLHGMTKEDAKSEIIHQLGLIDYMYSGIEFVHGYHGGQVLRKLLRLEFEDVRIEEKINISASSTLYLIKK